MERRIRGPLAALALAVITASAGSIASAPWASGATAQAQNGRQATQHCGAGAITVHAPAAGQAAVTPREVGLPAQAASLTAGANKVHARWLTSVQCRTLTTRHGLVPADRGGRGTRITSRTSMAATAYSYNWSGYYAATTQTPSSVTGAWTEPSVSLPGGSSEAFSAVWVGLGGMSSQGELVQDGTGQDVSATQGSDHFFWYELYPMENAVAVSNLPVAAGDQVSATSSWASGTATFGVCNNTRGICLSFTQASPAPDNTAEWIVEAPEVNGSQATPPVFSPVSFSGASFQSPAAAAAQTPADGNAQAIDMVTNSSTTPYLAVPGSLNGDAFTVTYKGPPSGRRPSLPLNVHLANGPSGGALTTVATWTRPTVATPAITSYQVRIQARSPQGVYGSYRYATVSGTTTHLSIAGTRGYLYRVEVLARNAVGLGPWSSWSNLAYPR